MGVKVTNRVYNNQYNTSFFNSSTYLLGNAGDWLQLTLYLEASVDFKATDQEPLTIDPVNKTFTLTNGKKWKDYGFDKGDTIEFTYDRKKDLNNDGEFENFLDPITTITNLEIIARSQTFTIENIFGNVMEVNNAISTDFGFYNLPTDRGDRKIDNVRVAAIKEPEGVSFQYAQMSNEDYNTRNLGSIIDGSTTEFVFDNLINTPLNTAVEMTPKSIQSGMAIDKCWVYKFSAVNNVYKYHIRLNLMVGAFFENQSNFENMQAPQAYFNNNSLTDNFLISFYPKWNNPNVKIQNDLSHTEQLGNTGWFNENYNGLPNPFKIKNLTYKDTENNLLNQLDFSQPTIVEFEVEGVQGISYQNFFNIGFAWIPQEEDDYHNKSTPLHKNLLMNTLKELPIDFTTYPVSLGLNNNGGLASGLNGYSFGGPKIRVDSLRGEGLFCDYCSPGSNLLNVKFKLTPNPEFAQFFESRDEEDRKYILWVSTSNQDDLNTPVNQSNRVSLLVDYNQMDRKPVVAGEFYPMDICFLEHPQSHTDDAVSNYDGFVEDDVLSKITFDLDVSKNVLISSLEFGYEVESTNTGLVYVLEKQEINTTQFPKNTFQDIQFNDVRGFKLEQGNNKNWLKLNNTGINAGTTIVNYQGFFATKLRWEDWLKRENVPQEFFSNSKKNNGYHNDWIDYLRNGADGDYSINFYVLTNTLEDGVFKSYKNKKKINIRDYDENADITTTHNYYKDSDNTLLNVGADPDTGKPLGVLLNDDFTRIEILYQLQTGTFDISKMYATITLEVYNGSGRPEHRQLSSFWGSESDNPLIPLQGETKLKFQLINPTTIKTSCLVDPSKLKNVQKYKITGRLGCVDLEDAPDTGTPTINCGESFNYNGSQGEFEFEIDFGSDLGVAGIQYDSYGIPDRFIIEWNGQVFDSGFVGSSSYDSDLINLGYLPSEINTGGSSSGVLQFNKTSAQPSIAVVKVIAPLGGTAWEIDSFCPVMPS